MDNFITMLLVAVLIAIGAYHFHNRRHRPRNWYEMASLVTKDCQLSNRDLQRMLQKNRIRYTLKVGTTQHALEQGMPGFLNLVQRAKGLGYTVRVTHTHLGQQRHSNIFFQPNHAHQAAT